MPSEMELVRLASFLLAASTLLLPASSCCCSLASCFTLIRAANSSLDMLDVADDTDKLLRLQKQVEHGLISFKLIAQLDYRDYRL